MVRYSIYNIEVINAAIQIAKQEGLLISLDLASFEVKTKKKSTIFLCCEYKQIMYFFMFMDYITTFFFLHFIIKLTDG